MSIEPHLKSFDIRDYDNFIQAKYSLQNTFIDNEEIYSQIKILTNLCPKLILAGSVSLHVLGIEPLSFKDRKPDLDFALTEPLTEEEFLILKSMLDLKSSSNQYEIDQDDIKTQDILKRKTIFLHHEKLGLNIDIFNSEYNNDFRYNSYNLYPINFGNMSEPHIVYVQHPSVTISHKMKYAFIPGYAKHKKHFSDCVDYLCKSYDKSMSKIKELNKMKMSFEQEFVYPYGLPKKQK